MKTLVLIRSLCSEIYNTHRTTTSFFIRQQTTVPLFIIDTGIFKCLEFPDCKRLSKHSTKHVIAIFQHLCLRCESSILSSSSKYPTYAPLNTATMCHLADLQHTTNSKPSLNSNYHSIGLSINYVLFATPLTTSTPLPTSTFHPSLTSILATAGPSLLIPCSLCRPKPVTIL